MTDVAVVTGANSGIGRATAIHLALHGYRVFGTVRRVESAAKLETMAAERGTSVELLQMDVADDDSVAETLGALGPVDVLVNNAGVSANGVVEETPPAVFHDVINVNVYGAVRCIQAVLPGMRERGRGAIVNVSSVAGRVAMIGQASYIASKWALEGMSEELAVEVAPFGVRVVIIEPGVTKSAIFAKNVDIPVGSGAYEAQYRRMFQFYATGIPQATDPFEVAATIHHAITTDQPRLRYPCSWAGAEGVSGRARTSDEDWVELGHQVDDEAYYAHLEKIIGISIRP